jgi:multimeric flavodoxin WrbA
MKILAINGSHRGDQGHTRFLIDLVFRGARAAGAECECLAKVKFAEKAREMQRSSIGEA